MAADIPHMPLAGDDLRTALGKAAACHWISEPDRDILLAGLEVGASPLVRQLALRTLAYAGDLNVAGAASGLMHRLRDAYAAGQSPNAVYPAWRDLLAAARLADRARRCMDLALAYLVPDAPTPGGDAA